MDQDIIGLIPAGGKATRISPLPCSKELFPLGLYPTSDGGLRPKAVATYLLEDMRAGGADKAFIVIRQGKWDIPAYYGDGAMLNMHIGYLLMNVPYGPPYTLDQAYPFVQNNIVVMGFPDILITPRDAFKDIVSELKSTSADVVLGLFPTEFPHKWDPVDLATDGRIVKVEIKPTQTSLKYVWAIAAWSPAFTQFMHEYLEHRRPEFETGNAREIIFSDIMQAAIDNGLHVRGVLFEDGSCLDVGTPNDLQKALQTLYSV
ncbi:nucleotidyltransferase family protein [Xanthocytophaga agilis]|uniref:glucose-1-phosphate thymidylyltransferase n=1 Tax=Xanthocytophaga agilis TaxID=3048010 RepID=A0AAE3R0L7_9BACT|nr:sugar phosphate nucleotidyltransferase [Xanthocytophaga agilis]MDJ1499149.1 sugar phosphate nucleotidyltransferase [Xanthocytophaga agilis]